MSEEISQKKESKVERIEISEAFEPVLPPKCPNCKTHFKQIETEDEKYLSSWKSECECYKKEIRIHVG